MSPFVGEQLEVQLSYHEGGGFYLHPWIDERIRIVQKTFYLFKGNVSVILGDPPDKDGSLKSFSFEINTFSLRKRRYLSHWSDMVPL